jgi:redox-sensitive bicupin YhaK (pirin superfamily)
LHSRRVFLAVLVGLIRLEEHRLQDSDSAMIWRENLIEIRAHQRTTLLLIDLP